ncbi:MAG TPA: hypothetical protein VNW04_18190 [Puia sp.]|jgi:hypothetical protein|nr:hypothetical protein [Puia sp.]
MESDFYRLYQDLPVPELVKVAKTPSDHMPEAVVAAERILKERGISREEIAAEEWVIAQKEMSDGLRKSRQRELLSWAGAFLLFYCLYYIYTIYVIISQLVWLANCTNCHPSPGSYLAFNLGLAVYITVSLYCIFRQLWLGWSLVLIQLVYMLSRTIAGFIHFYARHYFPHVGFTIYILTVLYIGLGIVLWQPHMKATFKVNAATQTRTLLVAAFFAVVALIVAKA